MPTPAEASGAAAPPAPARKPPLSDEEIVQRTAALWKYKPLPNDPDQSPEYRSHHEKCGSCMVTAARVRGKKHKHDGTNCDDWYEIGSFKDVTFLAVSDGAGSKQYSRVGAKASCEAAIGYLRDAFENMHPDVARALRLDASDPRVKAAYGQLAVALQHSVQKAYDAVETDYLRRRGKSEYESPLGRSLHVKDLSGTLLVAAIVPVGKGDERLAVSCQIGDGMIAVLNTAKSFKDAFKLLGIPDSGEFSGETEFLTSESTRTPEALSRRTMVHRGRFDHVLVMTDGVADDYDSRQNGIARLYLDLVANGILPPTRNMPVAESSRRDFARRVPEPLSFPWLNHQEEVALHSVDRICGAVPGVTLQQLWDMPGLLAACQARGPMRDPRPEERLRIWLDNYVQRGSFDDRTLVIASIEEGRP